MTRNIKALGLALLAAFAMSAVAASSASAVDDKFIVEGGGSAIVTGESNTAGFFELTGSGIKVECATGLFEGTVSNGDPEATVSAEYFGLPEDHPNPDCESSAGDVTVTMNSCDYDLTGDTEETDGTEIHATVNISCEDPEDHITIDSDLCTLHIPEQTPTEGGVTYTNEGGDVTIDATATGITYTSSGGFCGLAGIPSHGQDGDYFDHIIAEGERHNGEPVNIEVG